LVPFEQLPKEQQVDAFLFRAVVHALRPPSKKSAQRVAVAGFDALRVMEDGR